MKYLLALALLASPLSAQVWMGDTASIRENRPTRGYFYRDTTTTIGWKKWASGLPWMFEMEPTLEMRDWWFATAHCQGITTSHKAFESIRFFAINSEIFGNRGPFQVGYVGYFLPDSMAIYLALPLAKKEVLVRHEMTHALMWLNKEAPGHPRSRFGPLGCNFQYVP
jgi:hypothetical protein